MKGPHIWIVPSCVLVARRGGGVSSERDSPLKLTPTKYSFRYDTGSEKNLLSHLSTGTAFGALPLDGQTSHVYASGTLKVVTDIGF